MYPENPEGTQVIVRSMNMGYISDTARNRTHNRFRPKRESIPLGHSDGQVASSSPGVSFGFEVSVECESPGLSISISLSLLVNVFNSVSMFNLFYTS